VHGSATITLDAIPCTGSAGAQILSLAIRAQDGPGAVGTALPDQAEGRFSGAVYGLSRRRHRVITEKTSAISRSRILPVAISFFSCGMVLGRENSKLTG